MDGIAILVTTLAGLALFAALSARFGVDSRIGSTDLRPATSTDIS